MTSSEYKRRARLHFRIELRVLRLMFGESQQTTELFASNLGLERLLPREKLSRVKSQVSLNWF